MPKHSVACADRLTSNMPLNGSFSEARIARIYLAIADLTIAVTQMTDLVAIAAFQDELATMHEALATLQKDAYARWEDVRRKKK